MFTAIHPIVMTATITPRAAMTIHSDPIKRRSEYLKSLKYYSKLTHVYFLENSGYNLLGDNEFNEIKNVTFFSSPVSDQFSKGKGYQEFQMIDDWFSTFGKDHPGFLKVTGRYFVPNMPEILNDTHKNQYIKCIFERKLNKLNTALTDIFFTKSDFYRDRLLGCYLHSDDSSGMYIEKVIGKLLLDNNSVRVFGKHPIKLGISGSAGNSLANGVRAKTTRILRNFIYKFETRFRVI